MAEFTLIEFSLAAQERQRMVINYDHLMGRPFEAEIIRMCALLISEHGEGFVVDNLLPDAKIPFIFKAASPTTGDVKIGFDNDETLKFFSFLASGINPEEDQAIQRHYQQTVVNVLRNSPHEPAFDLGKVTDKPLAAMLLQFSNERKSEVAEYARLFYCFAAAYFKKLGVLEIRGAEAPKSITSNDLDASEHKDQPSRRANMSDSDSVTCPGCNKSFSNRRLVFQQVTRESCPFCNQVVKYSDGFSYNNDDANNISEIAGIDALAEQLRQQFKIEVGDSVVSEQRKECKWTVGNHGRWQCEIVYRTQSTGFFGIRLFSDESAEKVIEPKERLQLVCAEFAAQPWAIRSDKTLWGAEQFLSTKTLSPELFQAVVKRLDQAMQAALSRLGA